MRLRKENRHAVEPGARTRGRQSQAPARWQGLSQQALADAAGVSRRTIAGLEAGDANISLAKLSLIATALGANFTALVSPAGRAPDQAPDVLTWRGQLAGSQAVLHCSAAASHQVELWSWTLAPGERYRPRPTRKAASRCST